MRKILLSFVLLASLLGCLAQRDLEKKALIFPGATKTAHVVLKTTIQRPLTSLTLCVRFHTGLTRSYSLFSYATKSHSNEILLVALNPKQYKFHLGSHEVIFTVPEALNTNSVEKHVCVSWESATGLAELWVNGQSLGRKNLVKGHSIRPGGSIVLGQDQDSVGGSFDIQQSFVGEILGVYMWDRVLSPDQVGPALYNTNLPSSVINWKSLSYKIEGDVFVKPALSAVFRAVE
ncbi:C-reactive protein-like [Heteronotia binoei]|uniref:C-reactive protein-like n=1 Tax=Heteronotia binoei TaxID=13085 RepID=UPI0029300266|nr:C-reactive protein-like [Heteronotia binoei]